MSKVGYHLHGLQVLSPFDLPACLLADVDRAEAVVIDDLGEGAVALGVPDNPDLAVMVDGRAMLTLHREAHDWELRCPGLLAFSISEDLNRVSVLRAPGTDPNFAPMLLSGAALATVATLSGKVVLHASAVSTPAGAVAFAGPSGQGKSTVGALAALAGAPLFADDVLALDLGDRVVAHRGVPIARLRSRSGALANLADSVRTEDTVDGRLAAHLPAEPRLELPLAAVIYPEQSIEATEVSLRVLTGIEAFQTLARCMRLNGWCSPERRRHAIAGTAALAERTTVAVATIPAGTNAAGQVGEQLLKALEALTAER